MASLCWPFTTLSANPLWGPSWRRRRPSRTSPPARPSPGLAAATYPIGGGCSPGPGATRFRSLGETFCPRRPGLQRGSSGGGVGGGGALAPGGPPGFLFENPARRAGPPALARRFRRHDGEEVESPRVRFLRCAAVHRDQAVDRSEERRV